MPLAPLRLFPFDRTGQPDQDQFYPSNSNFFKIAHTIVRVTNVLLFPLLLKFVLEKFPANEDHGESKESVWKSIHKKIDTKCRRQKFFHTKLRMPSSPTTS